MDGFPEFPRSRERGAVEDIGANEERIVERILRVRAMSLGLPLSSTRSRLRHYPPRDYTLHLLASSPSARPSLRITVALLVNPETIVSRAPSLSFSIWPSSSPTSFCVLLHPPATPRHQRANTFSNVNVGEATRKEGGLPRVS